MGTRVQDRLWEEILKAAREGQLTRDQWMYGYRSGLVRAYSLTTGLSLDDVNGFILSELRHPGLPHVPPTVLR